MAAKKQAKPARRAGNHFWKVKNLAGNDAELILYGHDQRQQLVGRRDYPEAVC